VEGTVAAIGNASKATGRQWSWAWFKVSKGSARRTYSCRLCTSVIDTDSARDRETKHAYEALLAHLPACPALVECLRAGLVWVLGLTDAQAQALERDALWLLASETTAGQRLAGQARLARKLRGDFIPREDRT
jgi:hypothetical protein